MSAVRGLPGRMTAYAASKAGLWSLTQGIQADLLRTPGIVASTMLPGYIRTETTRALQEDPARETAILSRIPAGRWGDPEDLAGAAVFLASPASDYVHGEILTVDGGWMGR